MATATKQFRGIEERLVADPAAVRKEAEQRLKELDADNWPAREAALVEALRKAEAEYEEKIAGPTRRLQWARIQLESERKTREGIEGSCISRLRRSADPMIPLYARNLRIFADDIRNKYSSPTPRQAAQCLEYAKEIDAIAKQVEALTLTDATRELHRLTKDLKGFQPPQPPQPMNPIRFQEEE